VPIGRACCDGCARLLETRLRRDARVVRVRVDARRCIAHVESRPGASVDELRERAGECLGGRCPVPLADAVVSSHGHAHTARLDMGAGAPEARITVVSNALLLRREA
jgi:hypothetical protein